MKKIIILNFLVLSLVGFANAQKLISGGKPKLFKSIEKTKAFEIKFPNGVFVRKLDRTNEDEPI